MVATSGSAFKNEKVHLFFHKKDNMSSGEVEIDSFISSPGAENMAMPMIVRYAPGTNIQQIREPKTGKLITVEVFEEIYE